MLCICYLRNNLIILFVYKYMNRIVIFQDKLMLRIYFEYILFLGNNCFNRILFELIYKQILYNNNVIRILIKYYSIIRQMFFFVFEFKILSYSQCVIILLLNLELIRYFCVKKFLLNKIKVYLYKF